MRQIEFRAWNGESMHYGGFSVHATGLVESTVFVGDIVNLMQFTGIHDKNGVKIFEGDILIDPLINREHYQNGNYSYGVVDFFNGIFRIGYGHVDKNLYEEIGAAYKQIVIGNIHKNPELLEK